MKHILTLAAATAVGVVMAASAANAATRGECVNGYMRVDTDVLVHCSGGPMAQQAAAGPSRVLPNEPLYTGSISTPHRQVSAAQSLMAAGEQACKPGEYWEMHTPDQPRIMACN